MSLSERELKILAILAPVQGGASLHAISASLGYRPAWHGALAVRKTLNAMLHRDDYQCGQYGEQSRYVGRLPPQDRWGIERWFATDAGKSAVTS